MDCSLIEGHLLGYHLAALEDAERAEVEEHLVGCPGCVRAYLTLKADVERAAANTEEPREEVRLRLRAAVAARFRPTPLRRARAWLTRPVPLYQGVAIAGVVLALGALAPTVVHSLRTARGAHTAERVDTTRTSARSTTLY